MPHADRPPPGAGRTTGYWAPIVLFGVLTLAESYLPVSTYPIAYLIKVLVVTSALVMFRKPLSDIRVDARLIPASVAVGLAVFAVWVLADEVLVVPRLGSRTAFDPTVLRESGYWMPFIALRLFGLTAMVPVMEEIFWRSFLLRYLTATDFERLPVGTFSASALWIVVAASALAHPEWLVAIVAGLAYALWLRRTGSLFAAVVAHAATNAALGAYVISTEEWHYW